MNGLQKPVHLQDMQMIVALSAKCFELPQATYKNCGLGQETVDLPQINQRQLFSTGTFYQVRTLPTRTDWFK